MNRHDVLRANGIDSTVLAEWHLCDGMTYKQIAERLKCSVGTVSNLFADIGLLRMVTTKGSWKQSDRVKQIISKTHKGKKRSKSTRNKISQKAKERYESGFHSWLWKGGVKHRKDGYVAIWMPQHPCATDAGYVMEHRLVMEKHIGRYLTKEEVVHHKNGIRNDNRIENLELFTNSGEHQRYHALNTRKRNERGFV